MVFLFFLLLFFVSFSSPILASDNIIGLHLSQTTDIESAKTIINSTNGDWGWATIVIRPDQLDKNTWQEFFDNCRKYHIIPIVRVASNMQGPVWSKPDEAEIDKVGSFLNSLIWPSKEQHIILYNEVNHAQEWGGTIDPKGYADTIIYASNRFKQLNNNFIIMGAGLDLAAPSNLPDYESAENFYRQIYEYKPDYFDHIDAIASHSYPNHGFVGTPKDTGQHSILGYRWEQEFIKSLGVQKTFPVFITETGWPHREGVKNNNQFYTTQTTSNFLIDAILIWSADKSIQAITPFTYNYPNEPFDHFSWLDQNEKLYPNYQKLVDLPKNKNNPEQTINYEATYMHLPFFIFANAQYKGQITIKNTGQSIWNEKDQFCLDPQTTTDVITDKICVEPGLLIYPRQSYTFTFNFTIAPNDSHGGKTFISWKGLSEFEIASMAPNASIYRPKTGIMDSIVSFIKKLVKYKD